MVNSGGLIRVYWRLSVQVGDLVKYDHPVWGQLIALVLYVNKAGGTLRVFCGNEVRWFVTSGCEVISESR